MCTNECARMFTFYAAKEYGAGGWRGVLVLVEYICGAM